jgi:hypothetical protein
MSEITFLVKSIEHIVKHLGIMVSFKSIAASAAVALPFVHAITPE